MSKFKHKGMGLIPMQRGTVRSVFALILLGVVGLAGCISVKNATPTSDSPTATVTVNTAPTLSNITTLSNGLMNTANTISYATIAAAANEADAENNAISFEVTAVNATGTLTLNGSAIQVGDKITSADSIIYTPAANAYGDITLLSVKANDGSLSSSTGIPLVMNFPSINLEIPIELVDRGLQSGTSAVTFARTRTSLDTNDYDGTVTYYFEMDYTTATTTDRAITLINSAGTTVATLQTGTSVIATPTRIRTAFTPTSGSNNYRIATPVTTAAQVKIYGARIIVKQQNASKTKIYIPLTAYDYSAVNGTAAAPHEKTTANAYGALAAGIAPYFSLYKKETTNKLATIPSDTTAWTFEVVLGTSAGTVSAGLWNATDGTHVQVSSTDTSVVEVTSTDTTGELKQKAFANDGANFDEDDSFEVRFKTTAGTAFISKAGLWVKLTNCSKAQILARIGMRYNATADLTHGHQRYLLDLSNFSSTSRSAYFKAVGRNTGAGTSATAYAFTAGTSDVLTAGSSVNTSGVTFTATKAVATSADIINNLTDDDRYISYIDYVNSTTDVTASFLEFIITR